MAPQFLSVGQLPVFFFVCLFRLREGVLFINCKTDVELFVGSSVRVISVGQLGAV